MIITKIYIKIIEYKFTLVYTKKHVFHVMRGAREW